VRSQSQSIIELGTYELKDVKNVMYDRVNEIFKFEKIDKGDLLTKKMILENYKDSQFLKNLSFKVIDNQRFSVFKNKLTPQKLNQYKVENGFLILNHIVNKDKDLRGIDFYFKLTHNLTKSDHPFELEMTKDVVFNNTEGPVIGSMNF
jgi:hypothetical protein